ncbi:hypothetical protein SODALDRAFT_61124 [Sodiomyces alkalinus F11]|uniref:Zn(2)-C6 fungal-type domain-containing protein n=1 Tax=Sodiomyces alkalinus (strain CBS 110278 / VKM F-3762 / F11) TaxID=1314773 RepID=A0A3N2PLA5_SODAK|nr:hypothetical protein SODALDRAFT_61124 [Sodiomyces alkalinus F11]ROT35302.1 hypothetical protein SODALDRAFT_61124 [Sodiomyces alkalinus F11]
MPEGLLQNSRTSRVERMTTSCGECRRRKQKCDHGQPCNNCARRFPQPACEYKHDRRVPSSSPSPLPRLTGQLKRRRSPGSAFRGNRGSSAALPEISPQPWTLVERGKPGTSSGMVTTTTTTTTTTCACPNALHPLWSSAWASNREDDALSPGSTPWPYEPDLKTSGDALSEALRLLMRHYAIPEKFRGYGNSILDSDYINAFMAWSTLSTAGIPWPVARLVEEPQQLHWTTAVGATHPPGSLPGCFQAPFPILSIADLLRIDLGLFDYLESSVNNDRDVKQLRTRVHVTRRNDSHITQNSLLLQILLYTTACYLGEAGSIPRTLVIAHRGRAIHILNQHLHSDSGQASESSIAGVIQLISNEWYWGEMRDVRAHLRGLREMIRLRGGFAHLGMDGFLAKNAIAHDVSISVAHETIPFLQDGPEFAFENPDNNPLKTSHNSPLVGYLPSFSESSHLLGLHPATARILDDMRFLFNAVLWLPEHPTPQQLRKVKTTSEWMHNRLLHLNPITGSPHPSSRRPSPSEEETSLRGSNAMRRGRSPLGVADKGAGASGATGRSLTPIPTTRGDAAVYPTGGRASSHLGNVVYSYEGSLDPTLGLDARASSEPTERPDYLYRTVRLAALAYSRAIMTQTPISQACTASEFLGMWNATRRVPLATWKAVAGVFHWVMLAMAPACPGSAQARLVKSMLVMSVLNLGLENWQLLTEAAGAGLRVQGWLSRGGGLASDGGGGTSSLVEGGQR